MAEAARSLRHHTWSSTWIEFYIKTKYHFTESALADAFSKQLDQRVWVSAGRPDLSRGDYFYTVEFTRYFSTDIFLDVVKGLEAEIEVVNEFMKPLTMLKRSKDGD